MIYNLFFKKIEFYIGCIIFIILDYIKLTNTLVKITMPVIKLDTYLIELSDSKPKDMLKELKDTLVKTLEFMRTQYIVNPTDINEYKTKYSNILSQAHEFANKINSLLHLLLIVDESQTNKYKYEECLGYHMGPNKLANLFLEIGPDEFDSELKTIMDCSNLKTDEQINLYKEISNRKMTMDFSEKVDSFNSFINDYILSLVKVIVATKRTNI